MIENQAESQQQKEILFSLRNGVRGGWRYPQINPSVHDVEFVPLQREISPTPSPDYAGAPRSVLVLPLQIRNVSPEPLNTRFSHEWYGGEWPETKLFVYKIASIGLHPVYLVGETGSVQTTSLAPGDWISLDLRMDWPGTGSVRGEELMSRTVAREYELHFVLVFGNNLHRHKQYVVGSKTSICVIV